jgi:hypothetical protein
MPHHQGGQRAEDRSLWMRSAFILEKYRIIWVGSLLILTAFGFDFKTPKTANQELQTRIDSVKHALTAAIRRSDSLEMKLDILLKVPCLDKNRNLRDLQLIGLDCSNILPSR